MKALAISMMLEQDRQISEAVEQQRSRLRNFISRRVADPSDVEDILQEVFFELVEAYRLMKPVETASAWLLRVARNRIIDQFRKKKPVPLADLNVESEEGEMLALEEFLPSSDAGPEAAYARAVLIEELENALEELPEQQRRVFIEHEIEGRSFKELAAETGVSVNTLLSRKRYAVLHLRQRLQSVYDEFLQ
jgi:RNA polymerase sigma factor (sigma-70 family)